MEANVLTKATETFSSLAVNAIGASVDNAMKQVAPHVARVDTVVDGLAAVKAQSDGLVAAVDKKIAAADDSTAKALEDADTATKKLLDDAAAAQEKLLEKVQDDLKAGTDAMDATFSTIDADADDKKCNDDTVGSVRLFEGATFQFCDGKKWNEVKGGGGGETYGSRAEPWGKHCKDILDKKVKEGIKTLPDGVYWINGVEDPGTIRVWCDMTTDGGGWTLLLTWRNTFNNARHFFRAPLQNGFSEVLDPAQTPQVGPEEHATDSHHHNEPMAAGLSWKQRRDLWRKDATKKEYRWDSYRYDGGLHYAFKGTNAHSGNMLYAVAAGLNHNEIGRSFSNAQISGSYTVLKKKYASNLNKGQSYGVWSLGHYDCDCSEGYYINGKCTCIYIYIQTYILGGGLDVGFSLKVVYPVPRARARSLSHAQALSHTRVSVHTTDGTSSVCNVSFIKCNITYIYAWNVVYQLLGNWGDQSNMWVIFTDNVQDGERGTGGSWANPNHSNHAACWMR